MGAIDKLTTGDSFPTLNLTAVGGQKIVLPDDIDTEYAILLIYRGHWCPFCRRVLAGFEEYREELAAYGFSIFAGSVDSETETAEVAKSLNYPLAHSMSRADGDAIGAWWNDDRGGYIQPSEFILSGEGKVMSSTYSNSPLGRMDPKEALALMKLILT